MKKLFLKIFIVFIGFLATTFVMLFFFTESFYTHIEKLSLAWNGSQEKFEAGIQYYEKNECQNGQSCQCVLLLHGLGDTMITWRKTLAAKSEQFTSPIHFFAPNMPGSMDSALLATPKDYNIENLSQKIANIFLPKCDSWVVVGNSLGGWMAVDIALQSDKVKGLLLLDPAGLKKDYSHILGFFLKPNIEEARHFYHLTYAKTLPLPDFVFERLVARIQRLPVKQQLQTVEEKDYLNHSLPKLKVPVIFVWGAKDRVIPTAWATEYQKLTPRSQLVIVPDCGHIPQKECLPSVFASLNKLMSHSLLGASHNRF